MYDRRENFEAVKIYQKAEQRKPRVGNGATKQEQDTETVGQEKGRAQTSQEPRMQAGMKDSLREKQSNMQKSDEAGSPAYLPEYNNTQTLCGV